MFYSCRNINNKGNGKLYSFLDKIVHHLEKWIIYTYKLKYVDGLKETKGNDRWSSHD